jgi:hypothetical protein
MELFGHDSEPMSAHYTHVGTEALKKAAASVPVLRTAPLVDSVSELAKPVTQFTGVTLPNLSRL